MHLGNVFAALVAWLSARAEGGSIVLRIEDLDPRAQHPGVAETLMRDLEWLGLTWDEGPFWQSERGEVYAEALERLSEQGDSPFVTLCPGRPRAAGCGNPLFRMYRYEFYCIDILNLSCRISYVGILIESG